MFGLQRFSKAHIGSVFRTFSATTSLQNDAPVAKPCWIEHVPYQESQGRLRKLYDQVKGPNDNVDNIMLAHSLRPHSMEGHMHLYKRVLHHRQNTIAKWKLEMLGVFVSKLNGCDYCFEHHFQGMKSLVDKETTLKEKEKDFADMFYESLKGFENLDQFTTKEKAVFDALFSKINERRFSLLLDYAFKLTKAPSKMIERDINTMRQEGQFNDGEILEINQVISYFNYANRFVMGIGINAHGDILGLSPADNADENSWSHTVAKA